MVHDRRKAMRSSASASDISAPVLRSSRYCRTSARSPRWGRQERCRAHPTARASRLDRLRPAAPLRKRLHEQLESSSRPRSKNGRSWRQGDVKDHGPDGSNRRKADPLVAGRRQQRSSRMSSCRERRCRGPRSQPPGGENCLPEKHAKKYNNKDAKDKPPPTGTEGVIVLGGQPVGIAHVDTNSTPASNLSLTRIAKDFVKSSCRVRTATRARIAMRGPAALQGRTARESGRSGPAARQGSTALAGQDHKEIWDPI